MDALGVYQEGIVALLAPRSFEFVIGIFSIMLRGAAFAPMDPDYPIQRIAWMLEDTSASAILLHPSVGQTMESSILMVDAGAAVHDQSRQVVIQCVASESTPISPNVHPKALLYVIFTSGSTGRPKAVMIEHGSFLNLIDYFATRWEV